MYSMNSCMHRVEGECKEINTVPLSSQRFMAWSVSLCSGLSTTSTSNPQVSTVPWLVESEDERWKK